MTRKFITGIDNNNKRLQGVADPTTGTDGANKQYVDSAIRGIKWKDAQAASTANVSVSSAPATLDGVTLQAGDVVLLKDQTDSVQNGLWSYAATGTALTRASALPGGDDATGVAVTIQAGSTNDDTVWIQTADGSGGAGAPAVVGTDGLTFAQLGGQAPYTADGQGIELTGNQFSIELAASGGLSKSASGLALATSVAGNALTLSAGVLNVAPGTGLEISSDTIRIASTAAGTGLTGGGASALSIDTSVVARKFVASSAAAQTTTVTHNFGTADVIVQVYDASSFNVVEADVTNRTTNAVTVDFGAAVTAGQYKIVVIG